MSVGLLITSKTDPEQRAFIPVATQKVFLSKWLPGCAALKLEWIPLFETGIVVDSSNATAIVDELSLLRQWMAVQSGYEYELERISRLLEELQKTQTKPDLDVFIG